MRCTLVLIDDEASEFFSPLDVVLAVVPVEERPHAADELRWFGRTAGSRWRIRTVCSGASFYMTRRWSAKEELDRRRQALRWRGIVLTRKVGGGCERVEFAQGADTVVAVEVSERQSASAAVKPMVR